MNIVLRGISALFNGIRALLQGEVVSSKFFKRHFFATAFIVLCCLGFIATRFQHATNENVISSLEQQIKVINTEKQRERSRYMTLTRESAMIHLVDSLRLGLTIPDKRPENLHYDY